MQYALCPILTACLLASALSAQADNDRREVRSTPPGLACPPGLARKDPPCIPPGQARQGREPVYLSGDYILLENPARFGLDPAHSYGSADGMIYRIDRETREVLALIGAISDVLN